MRRPYLRSWLSGALALLVLSVADAGAAAQLIPVSYTGAPGPQRRLFETRIGQLEGQLRREARQRGVSERALRAIARATGASLPRGNPDQLVALIERKLREAAELRAEIAALRARVAALTDPAIRDPAATALARAAAAFADGRFDEADRELASLQGLRRAALDTAGDLWEGSIGARARLAALRLDFALVERLYDELEASENRRHVATMWRAKMGRAEGRYQQGLLGLRRDALADAIAVYRDDALPLAPRGDRPEDWAKTQNNLGNALRFLGEREADSVRLEQALAAYDAAIEVWTPQGAPLEWAKTEANRGGVFVSLGRISGDPAQVRTGIDAFHRALPVIVARGEAADRSALRDSLGSALATLGELERSPAILREALQVFDSALQDRPENGQPLLWATTQNNLGNALSSLGELEPGTARLEEAVRAFERALSARLPQLAPMNWASSENNLGMALASIGLRESGVARLELAIAAYRRALTVRTHGDYAYLWALTSDNLARALYALADKAGRCEAAVEASNLLPDVVAVFAADPIRASSRARAEALLAGARALRDQLCDAR